jgi:hypothetical protein
MKSTNRKWAGLVSVVCVATQCLSAYRDIASSVVEIAEVVVSAQELPGEGDPSSDLATEAPAGK